MIETVKSDKEKSDDAIRQILRSQLLDSIAVKQSLEEQLPQITSLAKLFCERFKAGNRVLACGNGGSACDAMHFAEELVARYRRERPGLPVQHLCDSAALTCWANDYSFEEVFARQVQALGKTGDILLIFSTSGNSTNILRALETAAANSLISVGLLGKDGGKAKQLCDHYLVVQANDTNRIQEAHSLIIHLLCEYIELKLFPDAR